MDAGTAAMQLRNNVMVAGHYARGLAGAGGKHLRSDFARVAGVHAETKRYPELGGDAFGDFGRSMREVSVNAGNRFTFEPPDYLFSLTRAVRCRQHVYASEKGFAGRLSGNRLAGFCREDCSQGAALFQRPDLI